MFFFYCKNRIIFECNRVISMEFFKWRRMTNDVEQKLNRSAGRYDPFKLCFICDKKLCFIAWGYFYFLSVEFFLFQQTFSGIPNEKAINSLPDHSILFDLQTIRNNLAKILRSNLQECILYGHHSHYVSLSIEDEHYQFNVYRECAAIFIPKTNAYDEENCNDKERKAEWHRHV